LSPAVLTGATVVASPALWSGLVDQTMPLDVALTRYLVALGICWALISLVAELAFPAPGAVRPAAKAEEQSTADAAGDETQVDPAA
jgi:hypothetical protein